MWEYRLSWERILFVRYFVIILGGILFFSWSSASHAQGVNEHRNPGVPWPATDGLNRKLSTPEEVGPTKPDRFVGMFYFLWHYQREKNTLTDGPFDVAKILARDPQALQKTDSPLWGPFGIPHYWNEPLYGYYQSTDPWILRRHAHQLADAGIDMLIFDTTNADTYPATYNKLCEVFQQVRKEGGRTPQIAFMVNTKAGETADKIFQDLYKPGRFRELWFTWQDKPLLLCDPTKASAEVKEFFTLRKAHWPFEMINTKDAWHWEATYPQPYGYHDDPKKAEQVVVSVAQNMRQSDGKVTNMSDGNARGRSFHDGKQDASPDTVNRGENVQEQWKRAEELQPPFVLVTGWNEWIAGRFPAPGGKFHFVDQYNQEFSRDIEPMRGGHGDNYYWQLVTNVRRYKGAPPLPKSSAARTIQNDQAFSQWNDVQPEFLDHVGETTPRDFDGISGTHYKNNTGRNDLVAFKVARDDQNVYFYGRTQEKLTSPHDPNWMWLMIDIDQDHATGWEGFDFIVNRTIDADGHSWLEKNEGGWKWKKVAPVTYRVEGNELHLTIPRAALGLSKSKTSVSLDFQWADNIQQPGDILNFHTSGDVAPDGRFRFRFRGE